MLLKKRGLPAGCADLLLKSAAIGPAASGLAHRCRAGGGRSCGSRFITIRKPAESEKQVCATHRPSSDWLIGVGLVEVEVAAAVSVRSAKPQTCKKRRCATPSDILRWWFDSWAWQGCFGGLHSTTGRVERGRACASSAPDDDGESGGLSG